MDQWAAWPAGSPAPSACTKLLDDPISILLLLHRSCSNSPNNASAPSPSICRALPTNKFLALLSEKLGSPVVKGNIRR